MSQKHRDQMEMIKDRERRRMVDLCCASVLRWPRPVRWPAAAVLPAPWPGNQAIVNELITTSWIDKNSSLGPSPSINNIAGWKYPAGHLVLEVFTFVVVHSATLYLMWSLSLDSATTSRANSLFGRFCLMVATWQVIPVAAPVPTAAVIIQSCPGQPRGYLGHLSWGRHSPAPNIAQQYTANRFFIFFYYRQNS